MHLRSAVAATANQHLHPPIGLVEKDSKSTSWYETALFAANASRVLTSKQRREDGMCFATG
jgi:hypothetical protein